MERRQYVKPAAAVQNLHINNFSAGACSDAGGNTVNSGENNCTFQDASGLIFFSSNCVDGSAWGVNIVNPNPMSEFAQLCYHRPLDSVVFFAS